MSDSLASAPARSDAAGDMVVSARMGLEGDSVVLLRMPGSLVRRMWKAALLLTVLIGIALTAQSVYVSFRDMHIFPYWDMMSLQHRYFLDSLPDFLLYRDNEHLPFVAMPFFIADNLLFKARGIFLIAGLLALNAIIAGLILDEMRRAWGKLQLLSFAAAGTLVILSLFWLIHYENLLWPKQIHMYLSAAFFLLASRLLAGTEERMKAGSPPGWTGVLTAGALLSASMFSFGYGAIGWIAALMVAVSGRWPWRATGSLLAIFALNAAIYALFYKYATATQHSNPLESFASPFKLAEFTVAYFANPVFRLLHPLLTEWLARGIATLTSLAACIAGLWLLLRILLLDRRSAGRIELFASLLILFAFGSALMTAVSRLKFGIETAGSSRYAIAQMPFWIGLWMIAMASLRKRPVPRDALVAVAGVSLTLLLVPSQLLYARETEALSRYHWQGVLAIVNGVNDDEVVLKAVHPIREELAVVPPNLAKRHWSVYADPQPWWLGQPARDLFRVEAPDRCRGSLDLVSDLGRLKGQSYVAGWAWDRNADRTPDWVVLVDGAGIVRGLARSGLTRPDVERALSAAAGSAPGWHGYVAAPAPLAGTEAYAVLADGSSICQLTRNAPAKAGDGVH
ncbi:hypothetical protein ABMY26_36330 (plasmid) [Azospirillum sp. HJ39]|uniref:hypothetical protein n=1 Tax=Azospirillum sp. HJ39 TaxID=3159496 RepID=UPI0035566924